MLDRTIVHDYYFHWDGDPDGEGRGALALGFVTLCNHSSRPCARVERNYARLTLDLVAIAAIAAGDEVTIDYGCTLWFEPCE
jgi:SET domain-containing protein